jgi:hypothetical protein
MYADHIWHRNSTIGWISMSKYEYMLNVFKLGKDNLDLSENQNVVDPIVTILKQK